jgi:hypothetical protein
MGHAPHMHGGHAGIGGLESLLPLLLALVVVGGLALVIWWFSSRRHPRASAEQAARDEIRENLDGQIMAMLHQAGGNVPQSQICAALGLPVAELAEALRRLEEEGQVRRAWQAEGYTFSVGTA